MSMAVKTATVITDCFVSIGLSLMSKCIVGRIVRSVIKVGRSFCCLLVVDVIDKSFLWCKKL